MAFFLRKLVAWVAMPVPVVMALLVAGTVLWWRGRERWGRRLLVGGLVLFWAASCLPLAQLAVRPLETAHPAFPGDSVELVVVLGGGHVSDPAVPVTARPSTQSIYRITEGVRIAVAQPWTTLVLSAYGGSDPRSHAEVAAEVAVALGVDPARIHREPRPRDTAEEAELLEPLLRGRSFALVTSATHMPRAVEIFRERGLEPVPAPTGHLSAGGSSPGWRQALPRSDALVLTRTAWYELLATAWNRIRP